MYPQPFDFSHYRPPRNPCHMSCVVAHADEYVHLRPGTDVELVWEILWQDWGGRSIAG